jgi:YfiH family protein
LIECRNGACEYLRVARLSLEARVVHAVFTRKGGESAPPFASLNLSVAVGDDAAVVRRNQGRVAEVLGLPLISARPVHGSRVIEIPPDGAASPAALHERVRLLEADAMMTDAPGFALFWAYADCVPILLYDPRHHAIALVHAGWRGSAGAIAARAVAAMRERFDTRPADLLAGIAPSIHTCCYEVSDEVVARFRTDPLAWESARFEERTEDRQDGARRLYLDLWETNRRQLLAAGLDPTRIELAGICTGCRTDLFYSHRVERGGTGRFGVAIGLAG